MSLRICVPIGKSTLHDQKTCSTPLNSSTWAPTIARPSNPSQSGLIVQQMMQAWRGVSTTPWSHWSPSRSGNVYDAHVHWWNQVYQEYCVGICMNVLNVRVFYIYTICASGQYVCLKSLPKHAILTDWQTRYAYVAFYLPSSIHSQNNMVSLVKRITYIYIYIKKRRIIYIYMCILCI